VSDNTAIEWSDASWNPVLGCARVSPGCDACYAIIQARIRAGNPNPKVAAAFEGLTAQTSGRADWTGRVNLLPERLEQPLRWRKPRKVFVNSLADLFHDAVPDAFIACVFTVMAKASQHTFQVLTKRHGRMRSLLSSPDFRVLCSAAAASRGWDLEGVPLPLPNVWLGVSVENQQWADIRIPALLATPAAVRWVSAEPLLGPVNLIGQGGNLVGAGIHALPDPPQHDGGEPVCQDHGAERCTQGCRFVDWVVAGGESGPGARPMHPQWARSLRDQCSAAEVPFLFKQWGAHRWVAHSVWDEGTQCWVDRGIEPQRVSKKLAGRELDGRTWDEFPRAAEAVPA
jgi:protein gp37